MSDEQRLFRLRAIITKIGAIVDGEPRGWAFDCGSKVVAIDIQADGSILHAGYTVDELAAIAANNIDKAK